MEKREKRSNKWIWLAALFLFICIVISVFVLVSRMTGFLLDDTGAIELNKDDDGNQGGGDHGNGGENGDNSFQAKPGFEAEDDKVKWETNTKVDIFSFSYENGEKEVTVKSDRNDKVIAPGTENSYTFKFKNTGNVALDYQMEIDAYFTPGDVNIPITARVNRYDGKWIVGERSQYAEVLALDQATDSATLGAGKYTYYTLDWNWPFEGGDDALDTMLGQRASKEDLTFTIVIKTTATESADPNATGGITPQTGDENSYMLWMILALISFVVMMILIFRNRKDAEVE